MTEPAPEPQHSEQGPAAIELAPGVVVPRALITFTATRSSGPGGQNVNKRSTRAELRVPIEGLPISDAARRRLARHAGRRLTENGELLLSAESERSLRRNQDECLARLRELLLKALSPPKPRRKTRPTKASKERRLEGKRRRSDVKKKRRPPQEP